MNVLMFEINLLKDTKYFFFVDKVTLFQGWAIFLMAKEMPDLFRREYNASVKFFLKFKGLPIILNGCRRAIFKSFTGRTLPMYGLIYN